MTSRILCFFLFSFILNTVLAQPVENHSVRFGIRAGVNFSHVNFSRGTISEDMGKTNFAPGATAGLLMIVPLINSLYVQPEYSYTGTGGKVEGTDIKYNFDYLTLPVFLRWEIGEKLSFLGGPQFEILINASQNDNGRSLDISNQTEERNIGLAVGSEYQINRSFGVGLRYIYGLNNISINRTSNVQEFKFENVQIAVTYVF